MYKKSTIEEKVFDKADEAQSLEELRQAYEKLTTKLASLKNESNKSLKGKLEEKISSISQEIAQSEEQKKKE